MHALLKKPADPLFFAALWRHTRYDVIATQQTNPHAFNIRVLYHYYTNYECTLQELAYFTADFKLFFLLIHNDITASDFDINRCHLNISAAYFSSFVFRLLTSRNFHNFSAICLSSDRS